MRSTPEPLQRRLQRAQHAVAGEVEAQLLGHPGELARVLPVTLAAPTTSRPTLVEMTKSLRPPQRRPQPPLGQAEAVLRGDVEEPHTRIPRRLDGRVGVLLGDLREEPCPTAHSRVPVVPCPRCIDDFARFNSPGLRPLGSRVHHRAGGARRPLPDVAPARRLGRDEPVAGLLGGVRGAAHERRRRGSRPRLHHRPRQRRPGRGDPRARAAGRRARRRGRARRPRRRSRGGSTGDSQLRWLGPEKGVMHMAARRGRQRAVGPARPPRGQAAVAAARRADPGGARRRWSTSATCSDALTREEALAHPARAPSRAAPSATARAARARATRPTPPRPGWLGYDDEKLARLCREAVADGFTLIKLKVGADLERRRPPAARSPARRSAPTCASPSTPTRSGASQRGDRLDATRSREFDPYWIEEPTSPDDVLGHAAIRARGRARSRSPPASTSHNRVMFKQLLQAGAVDVVQIDACRVGGRQREHRDPAAGGQVRRAGVPARRRRRPVRDGAAPGDVRLRRASAARCEDRVIEYVDHLHEHFADPVGDPRAAATWRRSAPGPVRACSPTRWPRTTTPTGPVWSGRSGLSDPRPLPTMPDLPRSTTAQ